MSRQWCSLRGQTVSSLKVDVWIAWGRLIVASNFQGCEHVIPIPMLRCVRSLQPPDQVTINKVEAKERNNHRPRSFLINRRGIGRGSGLQKESDIPCGCIQS